MLSLLNSGDRKSPQVSMSLLSTLANLNIALVWMVFTCTLISRSFSLFNNLFAPKATTMIGITVTFLSTIFLFSSLARSFFALFFPLCDRLVHESPLSARFFFFFCFFFLLTIIRSTCLAVIRWSVLSQNHREGCASYFPRRILGCAYTSSSYGGIKIFSTADYLLVLYSFYANLLQWLII